MLLSRCYFFFLGFSFFLFIFPYNSQVSQNLPRDLKGLLGKGFSLHELEIIKRKSRPKNREIKKFLFWHQTFPTVGLRLEKSFWPPQYPYIPHFFSLWDLAPHKGEGVRIALLDTGVSAVTLDKDIIKKNHDLSLSNEFIQENFNMVNSRGLDALKKVIDLLKMYSNPKKFNHLDLLEKVPKWISAYLLHNDDSFIKAYLKSHGTDNIVKDNELTSQGVNALNEIEEKIDDLFIKRTVIEPEQINVIQSFLPIGISTAKKNSLIAGHGNHIMGLISGALQGNTIQNDTGIVGLAPNATTYMVKAFYDNGETDIATFFSGIRKALEYNPDIINFGLKIGGSIKENSVYIPFLKKLIDPIEYVVAASGNSGDPRMKEYVGEVESYPARFENIMFDVGAFRWNMNNKVPIASFSQYEPHVGPTFVAPGFNILSAGLSPHKRMNSYYVFMHGTSMASAIISGFLALMLGEFKKYFTRKQLITTCYASTIRLQDTPDWEKKTLLGTIDMRTALFMLHCLKRIKETLQEKKTSYDFNKNFQNLVGAVRYILFEQPERYSEKYLKQNSDLFKNNFMTFYILSEQKSSIFQKNKDEFYIPKKGVKGLQEAVTRVSDKVLSCIARSKNFIKSIFQILNDSQFNLFSNVKDVITQKNIRRKLEDL